MKTSFTVLTSLDQDDLKSIITEIVRECIKVEFSTIKEFIVNPKSDNKLSPYLTRNQLKEMLGMSLPTISRLTKNGVLKGTIIGGVYRYNLEDISKLFQSKSN